ncbi:MAG: restriction endonuclease subunit S [Rhodocyclaceae bacterium]|nr:restriction endonuclease subunit S [Rhodocyclaceae bacterium]
MSEWVESPLAQLVTFQKGRKVDTSPFDGDGYAPYLGASGIEGGDDGFAATRLAVLAKSTDTLMLWDGERSGLVGYGRQGVVASTVSKLSPSDKVEPKYLYYALSERFDWIQHRRTGTGVPHVPKDLGRLLRLRYPKQRTIQKRIATILTGIDTAIEKTEALIAKYQQIKAGLMHDLFTRGVLPNGQLRPPREQAPELYQETTIGWIPDEWRVECASTLCSLITKGTTPASDEMWQEGDGIRFLRVDNLTFDGQLSYDASNFKIAVKTHLGDLARSRCLPGDVLTNIVGPPLGKVGVISEQTGEVNINQAIAVFRPRDGLHPGFLLQWLTTETVKRWFLQRAKQTSGQLNLTLAMCQELPVPSMGIHEQELILARAQGCERLIQSEWGKLRSLKGQKSGLMHDLLTGKVHAEALEPETVDG